MNNNYDDDVISIYDCFDYNRKINFLTNYCNFCRQVCKSSISSVLTTEAEILILLLNGGKGKEYNAIINFFKNLNLSNYIKYTKTGYIYKLIWIMNQVVENEDRRHFIAYCLNPITKEWCRYNDSIVS